MRSISGQNLSGFSTTMVQTAQMFMNNLASQAGSAGGGNRVMMAEACDVACDTANPAQWGAWGGAVGGLGTIGAGQSVGAVTYNAGGFAAGLDRRFGPSFLAGVTVGFTTGTQWVSGFDGKGTSDTFQVGLYGSFTQDRFYLDGLAGYGYGYNQSWRNILIPGLQPRTAMGQAGANQFFGQLETGYRVDIGGTAAAYVTPFARLQGYTATQNAYTETGAQSLNLNIAGVTTTSLRSVLGAVLGANMNVGWRSPIAGQLRLGWSHEYGNVDRPVSASFAGASAVPFTTYGVSPTRDGVLLGLSANTDVAEATSLYLKYEGTISGQDSAHAMTVGVRASGKASRPTRCRWRRPSASPSSCRAAPRRATRRSRPCAAPSRPCSRPPRWRRGQPFRRPDQGTFRQACRRPGRSPWPRSPYLSLSLSATGGRLTGGRGFGWNGTGAWRVSTEAFCTVGAGSPLRVRGAAMGAAGAGAAALFSGPAVVIGRAASVAGCGCGHGEATP